MLRIQSVTKFYGQQCALSNVSFEVEKGEIVGFIGPNGAGKSTLMKIITGYLTPTEGEVYFKELSISANPIEFKKRIGYLPEHNPLYPQMYIKEYLNFVAGVYGIKNKKERVDEIVNLTGLLPEINKKIGLLSKGYRQRVGIAQALIHNPDILILDEPTSGLDPNQLIEIRALIKSIAEQKCVLLSTHIMQEVEAICDRIVLINKGKIVANQSTQLIRIGSHTIIVEFNEEVDDTFFNFEGILRIIRQNNHQWLIECKEGNDIRENIFSRSVEKGVKVLSLQKKEKPLEEVFRELTNS